MRNFKKILALVLATLMVTAMAVSAIYAAPAQMPAGSSGVAGSGVTITVNRDSTFQEGASGSGRVFKWYRVFSATHKDAITSTGGGYSGSGAGDVTSEPSGTAISYIATPAVAAKLGTWVAASGTTPAHWVKASGNEWFTLTYVPGTGNYNVTWDNEKDDADTVQAAAQWLLENKVYEAYGDLNASGTSWTAEVGKGYYILQSLAGNNLIAATTDITVNEKNSYPSLDKTQNDDEDDTSGSFDDEAKEVAVGDIINYEVKVTIPATAAVGDKIVVWDKPSQGLAYQNDVAVKSNEAGADVTKIDPHDGESWRYVIYVNKNTVPGKDVVFSFSMKVTKDALIDTEKENESGLLYGRGGGSGTESGTFPYESLPDKVEYKTFFGGIVKLDGDGDNSGSVLPGVKFNLTEAGVDFKVSKTSGTEYYIPDPSGSSEVVTDEQGYIKIRGLDDNKEYLLTETATLDGYNLLDKPVKLVLHEDSYVITEYTPTSGTALGNVKYYVKSGTTYVEVTYPSGSALPASGTYIGTTTSGSSYLAASDDPDAWTTVLNLQGTLLPSTGGIGTTIFYIVGGLLAVGAGVVLVSKKRMGKVDD